MSAVVAAAVAQVDASDERHVAIRAAGVPQHGQFHMMRPPGAHPHVEQALAARGLDVLTQVPVLALAELKLVQVRPPDQAADQDPLLAASHSAAATPGPASPSC